MAWEKVTTPTGRLFDIPLIGGDFAKIGRVIDLYAVPCKPTAELWVYGFFQAIPTLFITLTKPELIDINIHKGHHRPRKGRRMRFNANSIFRDALIEVPVPRWVVFRVYEFSQKIGWYFLVADALEDFSINWISLAYKWAGCQATQLTYFSGEVLDDTVPATSNPLGQVLFWDTVAASGIINVNGSLLTSRFGTFDITWKCQWTPTAIPPTNWPYGTLCTVNGIPVALGPTTIVNDGERYASGHARILHPSTPQINVQIRALFATGTGRINLLDGYCNMDRTDDNELEPDP